MHIWFIRLKKSDEAANEKETFTVKLLINSSLEHNHLSATVSAFYTSLIKQQNKFALNIQETLRMLGNAYSFE